MLVNEYNNLDKNDIFRSEVFEKMAEQFINMIWEVHKEFNDGDALGINFEKKAFTIF